MKYMEKALCIYIVINNKAYIKLQSQSSKLPCSFEKEYETNTGKILL